MPNKKIKAFKIERPLGILEDRMLKNLNRFRVLTHKGVQFKLAAVGIFWFALFSVVLAGIFFVNYSTISDKTAGLNLHDQLVTRMLLVEQGLNLALFCGMAWFIFVFLMWLYLTVYTHRLTGPIYKLERLLEKSVMNESIPEPNLKFRKSDAFHELADLFNQFVKVAKNKNSPTEPVAKEAQQ